MLQTHLETRKFASRWLKKILHKEQKEVDPGELCKCYKAAMMRAEIQNEDWRDRDRYKLG